MRLRFFTAQGRAQKNGREGQSFSGTPLPSIFTEPESIIIPSMSPHSPDANTASTESEENRSTKGEAASAISSVMPTIAKMEKKKTMEHTANPATDSIS